MFNGPLDSFPNLRVWNELADDLKSLADILNTAFHSFWASIWAIQNETKKATDILYNECYFQELLLLFEATDVEAIFMQIVFGTNMYVPNKVDKKISKTRCSGSPPMT